MSTSFELTVVSKSDQSSLTFNARAWQRRTRLSRWRDHVTYTVYERVLWWQRWARQRL